MDPSLLPEAVLNLRDSLRSRALAGIQSSIITTVNKENKKISTGNHSTIFFKKQWQLTDYNVKEYVERRNLYET